MLSYTRVVKCAVGTVLGIVNRTSAESFMSRNTDNHNDLGTQPQSHSPHAPLHRSVLRTSNPFFAITGRLQMFGLNETSRKSSTFHPQFWFIFHCCTRKGTVYLPTRKAASPTRVMADGPEPNTPKSDAPKASAPAPAPLHQSAPMMMFFGATAFALVISTCTGLFYVLEYARRKVAVGGVFLAAIVFTLLLLLL